MLAVSVFVVPFLAVGEWSRALAVEVLFLSVLVVGEAVLRVWVVGEVVLRAWAVGDVVVRA